jgi:preprotein translocase subunit SecE
MEIKLLKYIDEICKEAKKIAWATKKEVMQITAIVFVVVFIASMFFLGVDMVVFKLIQYILKIGR